MPASPLQKILTQYRASSQTEREKGSYFEELIRTYFRFEASYADLYSDVWLFADWAKEIGLTPHRFAVCSDAEVGKKRDKNDEDIVETFAHELRYPATTDAKRHDAQHMSVIFSTHHSLDVLSRA